MTSKISGIPVKMVLVMLVMLTLWVGGTQSRESSAGQPAMNNGEKNMLAEKQDYQTGAVPSIDAQTPTEFETATFGLG